MSLTDRGNKLRRILSDLKVELDKFTKFTNVDNIPKIINCLYDVNQRDLAKVVVTLRKINNDKSLERHKYAQVYLKDIYKLISSKNHINDSDTHPIGQDLSIYSCAAKSQDVLNVKRLKKREVNIGGQSKSVAAYIIDTLNYKNESIQPKIKDCSLHTNDIIWFRLLIKGNLLESFLKIYNDLAIETIHDVFILSEEHNIIEIYFKKKAKLSQLLEFFNENDNVEDIIFCSELQKMKKMKIRQCDIFSNMLKFYYCYKTKNLTFTITRQSHLKIFNYVFLMCSIFIHSTKFTASNSLLTPLPLSSLSYYKPMITAVHKARIVEDISKYEKTYVAQMGAESLPNTASSQEIFKDGKRHKIYSLKQDRDQRMIYGYSTVGGVNHSEVVMTEADKTLTYRMNLLQNLST
ncbi:P47 [Homarus gammarus nudivirus]|uniref:P47 n=1 Tax=Homarus gammarus nudivirus TaxID=2509616 RepID=A0A411HB66_9VIRU|nr:P47 [Homarus gammarus nudivirus]QBB28613.1 P47 [Homarus gammarus nudivirus]